MSGVVVVNQLSAEIVNVDGYSAVLTNGVAIPSNVSALLVAGSDGSMVRFVRVGADGALRVDPTGTTAQPISGTITARLADGYGLPLLATVAPPPDTAPGLVVRVASSSSDGYLEPPSSAITTSVAAATTATTILLPNVERKGATIFNASNKVLYLLLGSGTVSETNYNVIMAANGYFEIPFGFTGQISGIWSGASGSALVGEHQ